ncbi:MAG TPA: hypothetical protein VMU50_04220 [Polyangia bacterium]|nr:hypothetical protein [Polyangia bacterium]
MTARRDLIAGAWWRLSLCPPPPALAWAGIGVIGAGPTGCAQLLARTPPGPGSALAEQQAEGWAVGGQGGTLQFPDAQDADAAGSTTWRDDLPTLAAALAPLSPRWRAFYSPTLFQSLQAPRNDDLRATVQPIFSPAMAVAARRGDALLSLFLGPDGACRADTALVIDLPGPEAVALAAALVHCFDPVFFFDNWPHPYGVVPAHLTLAAALYHRPVFERAYATRADGAPPMFVLDRQRLLPYVDDASQFDNRYWARLPSPGALASAGIRHLVYVTPNDAIVTEADDLNDDLVAIDRMGIPVRMLAMSDFQPDGADPTTPLAAADPTATFYFGGSPDTQRWFWNWYGWTTDASAPPVPPRLGPRCHYRPAPRFVYGPHFHGSPPPNAGLAGGGWRGFPAGRSGSLGRAHFGFAS